MPQEIAAIGRNKQRVVPVVVEAPIAPVLRLDPTPLARPVALVTPLRDRYSIEIEGGSDLEAKGNILDHEYEVKREGDKLAQVSKRWFRLRDTYGIEIAPDADDALILACTVAIDHMSRR